MNEYKLTYTIYIYSNGHFSYICINNIISVLLL